MGLHRNPSGVQSLVGVTGVLLLMLNGSGIHHVYVPQAGAAYIIKVSPPALITSRRLQQ